MTTRRLAGGLLAAALLLAPTVGAAATEVSTGGIRLGPSQLFPALGVTATSDSNVYLSQVNRESGWVLSVAPQLRLVLPMSRFFLKAEGGLDFLSYHGIDEPDSTNWFLGASVGAAFPGGLEFMVEDRHSQHYLTGSQEFGPGEDSSTNTLTGSVGYVGRDVLRFVFSGIRKEFSFGTSLRRERVETTLQADLFLKFRPTISAILEGSYTSYSYDSFTPQDGSATQAALGLSWDVTQRSTGVLKAGYQWKSYGAQDASLGTRDSGYLTLSATARHSFTPRTAVAIEVTRASQESDYQLNPYYLRTAASVALSMRLSTKTFGKISAQYASDEYPNALLSSDTGAGGASGNRTDTTLAGQVSLGFEATRWLTFGLAWGVEQRRSSFDTFEYDAMRVSLSAKAAF